ncbi:MAG: hypothetical protein ACYS14_11240 [Planctomycetota bacterium]|jgi:hypothetical protein
MPIAYTVHPGGHFVHAIASSPVTPEEFIGYEVAHAIDSRVRPPVSELLEIQHGACRHITMDDMSKVLERRGELEKRPIPHRCAIVVSYGDAHAWNLAKFYEGMVVLHSPEIVIVFGDASTARIWLGPREPAWKLHR